MEPRYTIHIYILLLCSALLFCRSVEEKGQLLMIFIFTLLCVLCKSMLNKCPSCKCLPLSIKTPSNLKQIKYSHNRKTYVGIHLSNLLIPHIFLWITHHLKQRIWFLQHWFGSNAKYMLYPDITARYIFFLLPVELFIRLDYFGASCLVLEISAAEVSAFSQK